MSAFSDLFPKPGIIVSCQADDNTPTDFVEMIVAFARSAEMGGAVGLRINSADHVAAVRQHSQLPIIAIQKYYAADDLVLITGDHHSIPALAQAGAEIIAFDATDRERPSTLTQIIETIHAHHALALADIRHFEDVARAVDHHADAVATTLTPWDLPEYVPNIDLIAQIKAAYPQLPIIAEGNFWNPPDVKRALEAGASAVVIGSAITRPWMITEYYVRQTR
jgi:N-acylglucosamine-6-phosphate 2-epimerase